MRLPVLRVERHDAVGEEIRAVTIAAVEVVARRAGRDVDDAARLVDGELAPVVDAAAGLERGIRPGVGA